MRVAISGARATPRAISRPAMFTQPISRTSATAPQRIRIGWRTSAVSPRWSGTRRSCAGIAARAIQVVHHSLRHRGDVGVRLGPRDARLETRDDAVVLAAALARAARPHRRPQIGRLTAGETGRHHADDRVRLAAQRDRSPDRAGVAVEQAHPEAMAEDRGGRAVRPILVGGEFAAARGRDAEHAKEAGRHALLRHVLRVRARRPC